MKLIAVIHVVLALCWLVYGTVLGLGVAILGNEEAMLSLERGVAQSECRILTESKEKLRLQLQSEACRDLLELAVRDLGLPLEAVDAPRQGSVVTTPQLASYRQDDPLQ
jgi:hypothetical protein